MIDGLIMDLKLSPSSCTGQLGVVDLRSGVCFSCDDDRSGFVPSKSGDGSSPVATVTASLYLSSLCLKPPFENSFDISSKLWNMRTISALTLLTEPSGGPESGACRDQKTILIFKSDSGSPLEYLPHHCFSAAVSDGSSQVNWDDVIREAGPLAERQVSRHSSGIEEHQQVRTTLVSMTEVINVMTVGTR